MPYVGRNITTGNFAKLDTITTSATATYNLLNGGVAYSPQSPNHCIVSLNGVIQSPTTSFTISGSTIVFASALTSADVIDFILVLGDVLNIGTPSDATVGFSKVTSNLITGATAETSIAGDDLVLLYDDSATALRKMTRTNFVSGLSVANTPSFKATGTTQSIPNATATVLAYNTESWDSDNCYDNSTYRFTPNVAGKYFVYGIIRIEHGSSYNHLELAIRKNGTEIANAMNSPKYYDSCNASTLIEMNGTTDYIDFFVLQDSGTSKDTHNGVKFNQCGAFKLIGV